MVDRAAVRLSVQGADSDVQAFEAMTRAANQLRAALDGVRQAGAGLANVRLPQPSPAQQIARQAEASGSVAQRLVQQQSSALPITTLLGPRGQPLTSVPAPAVPGTPTPHLSPKLEEQAEKQTTLLARIANFAGWVGPQQLYYGQRGIESLFPEMGAGGMFAGMAGFAGLAAIFGGSEYLAQTQRTGMALNAAIGAAPPGVSAVQAAQGLSEQAWNARVDEKVAQQIQTALAAGGLSRDQATGQPFQAAAYLVNAFGLSVQQATEIVSKSLTDLGKSSDDLNKQLYGLTATALITGAPGAVLGQLIANVPNMAANLPPGEVGPAAGLFAGMYGSQAMATSMAQLVNARGGGAYALTAMTGLPLAQVNALQGSEAGQARLADLVAARYRAIAQTAGPDAAYQNLVRQMGAAGATPLPFSQFQELLRERPGAATAAYGSAQQEQARKAAADQQAQQDLYNRLAAQGGAGSAAYLAALRSGYGAGAATANPPGLPDLAGHAARTGLLGLADWVQQNVVEPAGYGGANLATLENAAGSGGQRGFLASHELYGRMATLRQRGLAAYQRQYGDDLLAQYYAANPSQGLQDVQGRLSGAQLNELRGITPAAQGGGGGGQRLTGELDVTIKLDDPANRRSQVTRTKASVQGVNQRADAYVPGDIWRQQQP